MINRIVCGLILILLVSCAPSKEQVLSSYQLELLDQSGAVELWKESQSLTDGCSSPLFVDRIGELFAEKNWNDCCWQHDFDYNYGWLYGISREMADYSLWSCVVDSGNDFAARFIYTGVKIGGSFCYNNGD